MPLASESRQLPSHLVAPEFGEVNVGREIDRGQMAQLDDLDTGTDVDIWDHKIAAEMRDLTDVFAELADENQIVAPWARLTDANGQVLRKFAAGLPGKVRFRLPASSPWFELEVNGKRIRQELPR